MSKVFFRLIPAALLPALLLAARPAQADEYELDPMHTGATFKISHLGLSWTYGRFNDVSGGFTLDADPARSSFTLTLKTESVDTNNKKRDDHLRSPDFFNVKQFPVITFKSTSVRPAEGGFEVTGDLTMHGVTRSITFPLRGGRTAEFPQGTQRTGYTADLSLKRSEFGVGSEAFKGALGDDVYISVSFEGVKK